MHAILSAGGRNSSRYQKKVVCAFQYAALNTQSNLTHAEQEKKGIFLRKSLKLGMHVSALRRLFSCLACRLKK